MHNQTSKSRESRTTVYHQKIRIIDIPTGRLVGKEDHGRKIAPAAGHGLHDIRLARRP